MSTPTDQQLLARFVSSRSDDEAFAELLRRHADWVYSAALRLVRDPQHADDVTQAVFILLAQRAHRIRDAGSLRGWLLKVTRYTADHVVRAERRRQRHERRAAAMRPEVTGAPDPQWEQISALLDDLVARLSFADRDAILLRFYQRKSMAEVGAELAVSEDAAKKRVARATERLRGLFARRGITLPAAALGAALIANTTQAAPVALSAASSSGAPAALAKGVSTMMTLAKMKMAAAAAVLFLLLTGAGIAIVTATRGARGKSTATTAASTPATAMGDYYIQGQVPRSGVYSFDFARDPINLKQAIAEAGGVEKGFGDATVTVVRRDGPPDVDKGHIEMKNVALDDIFAGRRDDVFLRPNDVISVRAEPKTLDALVVTRNQLTEVRDELTRRDGGDSPAVKNTRSRLEVVEKRIAESRGATRPASSRP